MKIINLLELDRMELKKITMQEKYSCVIQKKIRFLLEAYALNVANIAYYYLVDNDETTIFDSEKIKKMIEELKCDWVEVKRIDSVCRVSKDKLYDTLCSLEKEEVLVIREFIPTKYCGYAWVTPQKHNFFIEAYKGGFLSFWNAEAIPSHYILNKNGNVISENICSAKCYYDYNYEKECWVKNELEQPEQVEIDYSILEEIKNIVKKIDKNQVKMKIAWILSDKGLTVFDVFMPIGLGVIE